MPVSIHSAETAEHSSPLCSPSRDGNWLRRTLTKSQRRRLNQKQCSAYAVATKHLLTLGAVCDLFLQCKTNEVAKQAWNAVTSTVKWLSSEGDDLSSLISLWTEGYTACPRTNLAMYRSVCLLALLIRISSSLPARVLRGHFSLRGRKEALGFVESVSVSDEYGMDQVQMCEMS